MSSNAFDLQIICSPFHYNSHSLNDFPTTTSPFSNICFLTTADGYYEDSWFLVPVDLLYYENRNNHNKIYTLLLNNSDTRWVREVINFIISYNVQLKLFLHKSFKILMKPCWHWKDMLTSYYHHNDLTLFFSNLEIGNV